MERQTSALYGKFNRPPQTCAAPDEDPEDIEDEGDEADPEEDADEGDEEADDDETDPDE